MPRSRHDAAFCPPEASASSASRASLTEVLDSVVQAVGQLAPGIHAGISEANQAGGFETLAATDPLVFVLDDLQYDLDEGPCLTAIREGHTVSVDDAASEHRWPRFMPRAVELGVRAQTGLPLSIHSTALGSLNIYCTTPGGMDDGRLVHAKALARHAAFALHQTRIQDELLAALSSSRTIGKAIGLIMERLQLDEHDAFEHLSLISQQEDVRLRDVAAQLVSRSNEMHRPASTP